VFDLLALDGEDVRTRAFGSDGRRYIPRRRLPANGGEGGNQVRVIQGPVGKSFRPAEAHINPAASVQPRGISVAHFRAVLIGMSDALPHFMAHSATQPPAMKWWTSLAGLGTHVSVLPGALALCSVTTYNEPDDDDESAETGCQASGP
jgi:hypothetical protein